MRLDDKPLGFVLNFLLGVAWAAVLVGAITSFLSFFQDSLVIAIVSAFVGAIPGLVAILLLEHIITSKEKYAELQKQTALLEKLLNQKENNDLK